MEIELGLVIALVVIVGLFLAGRLFPKARPKEPHFSVRVVEIGRFIQSALSRHGGIKKPNSFAKYVIASGLSGNHCKHVNSTHLLVVQRHLVVLAWFFCFWRFQQSSHMLCCIFMPNPSVNGEFASGRGLLANSPYVER